MKHYFSLIGLAALLCATAFSVSATAAVFDLGERAGPSLDLDVLMAPDLETVAIADELMIPQLMGADEPVFNTACRAWLWSPVNTEHGGAVGEYDAGTIALA